LFVKRSGATIGQTGAAALAALGVAIASGFALALGGPAAR
jgi:hypothetical protein